jgi:lipopolysaccharide export system permease protein
VDGPPGKEAGLILDRMLLSLQTRVLLVTLAVLLVLGLVIDFFESARYLFSVEGTAGDVFLFYLCKIPFLTHLLLPISLVISCCICFAVLGRSLQLRAIAAAGIGPLRLAAPTMLLAGVVAGITVLLAEFLVPPALDRTEKLMIERFGVIDQTWRFYRNHYWYRGEEGRLFRIYQSKDQGRRLRAVTLFEMDPDFHIRGRTDLNHVAFEAGDWIGRDMLESRFEEGRLLSSQWIKEKRLDWPERPGRFRDLRGRPKQKSLAQLSTTIAELEGRGLSATKYRLELHNRFAYPFLALGLVLLALPWLCVPSRRRTTSGALIEAMGLVFGAYFLVMIANAAVSGGVMSVTLGVWLPVGLVTASAAAGWLLLFRRWRSAGP